MNLKLPHKSPSRAALRTLSDQMKEVGYVITGDEAYFDGKNTTPSTTPKRPGEW